MLLVVTRFYLFVASWFAVFVNLLLVAAGVLPVFTVFVYMLLLMFLPIVQISVFSQKTIATPID